MTDMYESLEKLGLTRNEVTIYKYLLRKGVSSGAQIWGENSLDKSSAYRAIGQLQEKRLIYAIGETRNQKFAAYPVEALKGLHQKVASKLAQVSNDIEGFITDINEYAKENYKSNRIQLYEGEEGYKLFARQRLEGHVDLIRQIVPDPVDVGEKIGFHSDNENFIQERMKRNIPIKILFGTSKSRLTPPKKYTDASLLKEVRGVQLVIKEPVAVATHGSIISLVTREDGKFMGLVIKDKLIVSLFNGMFDYIWEQGMER